MKILIVGGGISGLTLGAFLENSEIEYDIVEKVTDWSHQGFLVVIWDNGRDILKKLGLAEEFDARGSRIKHFSIRSGSGRVLRDYSLSDFYSAYGGAQTIIERAELHALLLKKVPAEKIRMSVSVQSIVQNSEGVSVSFTDGRTETYDAVVGADGIHSSVRALVFGEHLESYTNWRAWLTWVDTKFSNPGRIVEYIEAGQFIAIFSEGTRTFVNFIASSDHRLRDSVERRMQTLHAVFKDEVAVASELIEKLRPEDVMPTDLIDVSLPAWSKGRVVLVGDAAHSFGPIAGMGCSMAMEDAYVLAGELLRKSPKTSFSNSLESYWRKQKQRVDIVRNVTRKMRAVLFIKNKFLRRAVNTFIPYAPAWVFTADYRKLLEREM